MLEFGQYLLDSAFGDGDSYTSNDRYAVYDSQLLERITITGRHIAGDNQIACIQEGCGFLLMNLKSDVGFANFGGKSVWQKIKEFFFGEATDGVAGTLPPVNSQCLILTREERRAAVSTDQLNADLAASKIIKSLGLNQKTAKWNVQMSDGGVF